MKLLVIGAAGRTGKHLVEQALAAGYDVTAYVRHPEALTQRHDRLFVVQGDVLDPVAVSAAVEGKDAVVSALGVKGRDATTVFSAGIANVIEAMKAKGVRRVITISTAGLDSDADVPLPQRLVATYIVARLLRNLYRDQARMEAELEASGTDWTIIRAPLLTDKPAVGTYRVAVGGSLSRPERISRADLAAYIVSCITVPDTYGKKVMISY
jgi:putative NADH-flavin reductase